MPYVALGAGVILLWRAVWSGRVLADSGLADRGHRGRRRSDLAPGRSRSTQALVAHGAAGAVDGRVPRRDRPPRVRAAAGRRRRAGHRRDHRHDRGVLADLRQRGSGRSWPSILFALLALAGVALVLAPLLWRMFGQLREERVGRIREAERAEIAAMVHDQVLHTLALIQRNAGDSEGGPAAGPWPGAQPAQLALQADRRRRRRCSPPRSSRRSAEVEDTYAIAVESVVVGDAPMDDRAARARRRGARGDGQRGPAREGDDRFAVRRGGAGAGQRVRPRPWRRLRHVRGGR